MYNIFMLEPCPNTLIGELGITPCELRPLQARVLQVFASNNVARLVVNHNNPADNGVS